MPAAGDDDVNDHQRHQIPTSTNRDPSFSRSLITVFSDSFQILISNPKLFSSIFLLLSLPLSLLLSSISLSSTYLRRRILHLRSLAAIVSVRIEALNILEETRKDDKSLFRLRALHALITLPLSTLLLIATISSAASLLRRRRRLTTSSAVAAIRSSWWRSLLTGLLVHAAAVGYGEVARTAVAVVAAMAGTFAGLAVSVTTVVVEAFLKSVLDMAMVVSVVEERVFGVDACLVGWELMEGRRMVGWAVAATAELATGVIWWRMVGVEEIDVYGGDWKAGFRSTAGMGLVWKAAIAILYAFVLIWSNVVLTALNCDCTAAGFKHVDDDCL